MLRRYILVIDSPQRFARLTPETNRVNTFLNQAPMFVVFRFDFYGAWGTLLNTLF